MTKKTIQKINRSVAIMLIAGALMVPAAASAEDYNAIAAASIAENFDPSRVDPVLYVHQKVGAPYVVSGQTFRPAHNPKFDQTGHMSWYGARFQGKPTANGERFNRAAMTAAHKTLPLNSLVVATNMVNGKSVTVRINDRGPFIGNGIIDLSEAAAAALGYGAGPGLIRVQYAGPAIPKQTQAQQPQNSAPVAGPQVGLPRPVASIPKANNNRVLGEDVDDQTTVLTIKGPVHMATHSNKNERPHFIRGPFRTYKTK